LSKKTPKKASRSERRERNIRAVKAGIKIEKPLKVTPLPPLGARGDDEGEAPAESERRPTSGRADKASTKDSPKKKPSFAVIAAVIGAAAIVAYGGQSFLSKKDAPIPASPNAVLTAGAVVHPFGAPSLTATATEPRVIQPTPAPEAPTAAATATATSTPAPIATAAPAPKPTATATPPKPKPAATKPAPKPKAKSASDDPY
jgi:hypothetical protein